MDCPKSRDITCTEGTGNGENLGLAQRRPQQQVKLKFTVLPGGKSRVGECRVLLGRLGLTASQSSPHQGSLFTFQASAKLLISVLSNA